MSGAHKDFESFANHWRYDLTTDENGFYQDSITQRVFDAWSCCSDRIAELEREKAELVAKVEILKKIAYNADGARESNSSGNYGDEKEWLRHLYNVVGEHDCTTTPTQCLNQIKAEAGRAGFVAGYDSCWFQHYGTRPPEHATAYSADQYAASIAKGE